MKRQTCNVTHFGSRATLRVPASSLAVFNLSSSMHPHSLATYKYVIKAYSNARLRSFYLPHSCYQLTLDLEKVIFGNNKSDRLQL